MLLMLKRNMTKNKNNFKHQIHTNEIKINTFQTDLSIKISFNNSYDEEVSLFFINLKSIQFPSPKKFK